MRGRIPGPASQALAARLAAVESRNVTHLGDGSIFWAEALGTNVRDTDGSVFVDLTSAFGVAIGGHRNPVVEGRVDRQRHALVHGMGDVHPPAVKVELLERVADASPWPEARTVLASAGSEAVEIAMKTAQLSTGRSTFVAFDGAYHGLTLGALAATARPYFKAPFRPRVPTDVLFVPWPGARRGDGSVVSAEEAISALDAVVERGDVAAILVEPVQGRAGVRVPPDGFLMNVVKVAHAHGALVIADEVYTGMGRCGAELAGNRLGLLPDLICLGKAFGGGYPLSACVGRVEAMDAWPPSPGEALHTSTFLGHPVACSAALGVFDLLDDDLAERANHVGERLRRGLAEEVDRHPAVCDVRGLGAMVGVEFCDPRDRPGAGTGARVAAALLQRGYVTLPAGDYSEVIQFAPPATLSDDQIDAAVDAVAAVIQQVNSE